MTMDTLKLWSSIRDVKFRGYPLDQINVTGTQVGGKFAMDVNIVAGGGGGGSSEVVIKDSNGNYLLLESVGPIKTVPVSVEAITLDHTDDSVSLGANGTLVSNVNPLPSKIVDQTLTAFTIPSNVNYTEGAGAQSITIQCESGTCKLQGGKVLNAGESVSFAAPLGYKLAAFPVTNVTGTYTLYVLR